MFPRNNNVPAVNKGRGGQWPTYEHQNVLGQVDYLVTTARTGVGLGERFNGDLLIYQSGAPEYAVVPDANLIQDGVIGSGLETVTQFLSTMLPLITPHQPE